MRTTTQCGSTLLIAAMAMSFGCGRTAPQRFVPEPSTRRMTHSGEVVGTQARYNSHAWLGIPYAKPPVGALRWRAPPPSELPYCNCVAAPR